MGPILDECQGWFWALHVVGKSVSLEKDFGTIDFKFCSIFVLFLGY